MRFKNRTVLVTGGGSGIGRVIAHRFAAEGAAVLVADRFGNLAEKVAQAIRTTGGEAVAAKADVTLSSEVDEMVVLAERKFRGVDILINNAAICTADDIAKSWAIKSSTSSRPSRNTLETC